MLYSPTKQKPIEKEVQEDDDRMVTLHVSQFLKGIEDTNLYAKEKAALLCSIFGLKFNEAKKLVYELQKKK